jgi:hypothetical protein
MPTVLLLEAALFAIAALLLPLRPIRGWRLTTDEGAVPGEVGQFRIGDLLLWMAVISVPLALFSFVNAQDWQEDSVRREMRVIGERLLLMLLPLHWLALLAAFAPRGLWHARVYRAGILLYAGIAIPIAIGASRFLFLAFSFGLRGGMLGRLVIGVFLAGLLFVISALVVWLNVRALRSFGWRLVRPAWQSDPAPQAAEVQGEVATAKT